jgi:pSer/pThr/pTyr-binding forkhead associated (FHA) protein
MATYDSGADIKARLEAERSGLPFVHYRDGVQRQRIVFLGAERCEIGRLVDGDRGIRLEWDEQVSRAHAVLEQVGGVWTVVDDGLSRNGTFINGEWIRGQVRLADGDVVTCGSVRLTFRDPSSANARETAAALALHRSVRLSETQREVLVALCRPLLERTRATPATNKEIALEIRREVDTVKTHLRRLATTLGVDDLPQNRKRAELAWRAIDEGLVHDRDIRRGRP